MRGVIHTMIRSKIFFFFREVREYEGNGHSDLVEYVVELVSTVETIWCFIEAL